jgi:hypothetical protein
VVLEKFRPPIFLKEVIVDIVTRVKGILLSPVREWEVIEGESASVASLYTKYAVILALIPAVASFILLSVIGLQAPLLGTFRVTIVSGLILGIINYALALAMLYAIALIMNALAPKFGGQPNLVQALKVSVYSATPQWVASVLLIIPMGGLLVWVAGIYSLALYWLGMSKLMKVPEEKKVGFSVAVVVCVIVLAFVVSYINGALTTNLGMGDASAKIAEEMMREMMK